MSVTIILSVLFVVTGIFFMSVGSIGIIRLPDFFARTHAASKSDTLGVLFVIGGLIIFEGLTLTSLKLALIIVFIALSNPIGTHAIGNAAIKRKVFPLLRDDAKQPEDL